MGIKFDDPMAAARHGEAVGANSLTASDFTPGDLTINDLQARDLQTSDLQASDLQTSDLDRAQSAPSEVEANGQEPGNSDGRKDDKAARGLKKVSFTRNEGLVYEMLRVSKTPLKAYDLLSELKDSGVRAPMSVYRALEGLITKGYVKKIESLNAYIARLAAGPLGDKVSAGVSAFIICRECSQAKEIILDEDKVASLFAPLKIAVEKIRIEADGDCAQICDQVCGGASCAAS